MAKENTINQQRTSIQIFEANSLTPGQVHTIDNRISKLVASLYLVNWYYYQTEISASVLARAIQRGYHYAGIYSRFAKFFAAMHFPLALCKSEVTVLKKMFTKYKKSI